MGKGGGAEDDDFFLTGVGWSITALKELSSTLLSLFNSRGYPEDIRNAIRCQRLAIHLMAWSGAASPLLLSMLGRSYMSRFNKYGKITDLEEAIECLNQLTDINTAFKWHNQALQHTPENAMSRLIHFNELGSRYVLLFQHRGDLEDIDNAIACFDKAIEYHSRAVRRSSDDQSRKLLLFSNLADSHLHRFKILGELADVEKAIEWWNQALRLTPNGNAGRPAVLNNLGDSYLRLFEHRGELADVGEAIACHTQAVRLAPDSHVDKPSLLTSLGNSYLRRFERYSELSDLNNAIEHYLQVEQLTPAGCGMHVGFLNSLGQSYRCRFEHLGGISDIDKAIECLSKSLRLINVDHADRLVCLGSLGTSYMYRFLHQGELLDVEWAIRCLSEALQSTSDGQPSRPFWFNDLGAAYISRFEHSGEPGDADKAIECLSQAVRLTPEGHIDRPRRLNGLGRSHMRRFEYHGELDDITKAIECQSQALQLTSDENADRPSCLNNLAGSHLARYEHCNELEDIEKAIDCLTEAVHLTPDGQMSKQHQLNNLGQAYSVRFGHNNERSDLITARDSFKKAAQCAIGNPNTRFTAARRWARGCNLLGDSPMLAYEKALGLVPQRIWLGMTITERYGHLNHLQEIGSIAIEAAAWAISLQEYARALEWLEEGRSIVWNQILQLRTPFDELSAVDPSLGGRLREIARGLECGASRPALMPLSASSNAAEELERVSQQHRRLATEWDQLLEQVRQITGFENFMRPRKADTLMKAAKDGPIIVISVYQGLQTHCDALIILPNSNKLHHLSLHNFSPQKAIESRAQLLDSIGRQEDRAGGFKRVRPPRNQGQLFKGVLRTLWSDVVKPILDFLGYTRKPPIQELPHVTWCTTGLLSFLPFHAAGCYDGSHPNTFDLVVSSYTPTLSALLNSSVPPPTPHSGVLAIGQERTKGLADLPNTVKELATIKKHTECTRYLQLDGGQATVNAVLSAMNEYSCVHLACHATQDISSPAQSAFHLHDGNLRLSTIMKRSFKNKGLAFLSACQTATGDERLPDEAVHLAAGMVMAGYPSVIATMWTIQDEDAPEVASGVYADLLKDGKINYAGAARALHRAVAGLRDKVGEGAFERWVPFLHIGV